ncbi:MAG TPA: hypothetical protein DCS29_00530 [Candidatus Magasanikbacteria bacterium]|nr:MAG: hypothetical protein A2479_03375 [Candidatus Magasanikbacteria bacterium RIFOXYC2_FULL_39_8]HAT03251.1 hypothetical protein [Candidatus Magasanikbacteria bacterium]
MINKDFVQLNKETYNAIAPYFAQTRKYLWDDLKPLKKYMKDGYKILDLGCGTGRLYHLFTDFQGIEYIGVDQSKGQLDLARKEFPQNTYIETEMTELPFEDHTFDSIYCIATFHHLPDEKSRLRSLQEMKRVLKLGGIIIMTNWNLHSKSAQKMIANKKYKVGDEVDDIIVPWMNDKGEVLGERYYHGFTLDELRGLFAEVQLELEDQYYTKKGEKGEIGDPGNIVSILHSGQ